MAALPDSTPVPVYGTFQRIMVPLDGSEFGERVLQTVVPIAQRLGAELTLLHVLLPRRDRPAGPGEISYPDTLHDRARSLASDYLSEVSHCLVQSRVRVKTVITAGDPTEMILSHAEHASFSMIALGARPRSALKRWLKSTVAEMVWAKSRIPVFLLNTADPSALAECGKLPETVLLPLSGSPREETALRYVRDLAIAGQFSVTLLGIPPDRELGVPHTMNPKPKGNGAPKLDWVEDNAHQCARQLEDAGLEAHTMIRAEGALEAIRRVRPDLPPHLIVMASGRRKGIRLTLFRKFADRLLRECVGPLILVPRELTPPSENGAR